MNSKSSFKLRATLAALSLLAGCILSAQTPGAQPAAADQAVAHPQDASAKLNGFAHRILDSGLKSNGLNASELKPWHMKAEIHFTPPVTPPDKPKLESAQLEVWWAGPYQWKRVYTSHEPHLVGAEWSESRFVQYRSRPDSDGFDPFAMNERAARPVIDPLYQAANFKPEYEMTMKRVNLQGSIITCVSVSNPAEYVNMDETNPDLLFPALCFDEKMQLRAVVAPGSKRIYDDFQLFQNRAVAQDVKIIEKGAQIAEMKVTLLEAWTPTGADELKPDKRAVLEPYRIEAGQPKPESVYEEGFKAPAANSGFAFRGSVDVPIVIKKDGSVKVDSNWSFWEKAVADVAVTATNKWKFKPYLVDGQPVEVSYSVHYNVDGKPFVPSYDRPKSKPVTTAPDDYSSTYDPKRDPAKDLLMAEALAKQTNRRILVEVGGAWCGWCWTLDKFFADHEELRKLRDSNFVLVKVNMSDLNENFRFLSQFPKIAGYPWLFILDGNGTLIASKSTDPLENRGGGYEESAVKDLLVAYKP
jgi:hypothetical protein